MIRFKSLAHNAFVLLALAALTAGCSSVKLDEQKPAPITDAGAAAPGGPDARAVVPVTADGAQVIDPFTDPKNPLSKKSVYFDFDSFVVKSEYQPVVEAHGRYLANNAQRQIKVELDPDRTFCPCQWQRRHSPSIPRAGRLSSNDRRIAASEPKSRDGFLP